MGRGALGCFVAHDHPGTRTDFFLAVDFPAATYGGPRHDLGLYDAILLFAIAGVLFALRNSGKLQNRLLHLLALLYAPGRFFFDTLRATDLHYVDARYFGLTPAQYGCILLVVYGLWGLATKRATQPGAAPPSTASGSVKPARAASARLPVRHGLQVKHVLEAVALQQAHGHGAAPSGRAVHHHLRVRWPHLREPRRQLLHRDVARWLRVPLTELLRRPHVQQHCAPGNELPGLL